MKQHPFQNPILVTLTLMVLAAVWIIKWRSGNALMKRLAFQMRSKRQQQAVEAIIKMKEQGWLYDGSLQGAILTGSHFKGFDLRQANLRGAWLGYSDFRGAALEGASLERADLRVSMLQSANLSGAYLRNANLRDAVFDKNTQMPDGSHWDCDIEITRFTDPHSFDFWCPPQPYSAPMPILVGELGARHAETTLESRSPNRAR